MTTAIEYKTNNYYEILQRKERKRNRKIGD